EEIADYSQNFKEGTAVLRGVSVNFYAGDKRASDNSVSSDSPLVKSVSFSKEFDMTKFNEVSITTTENRKSITYFTGGQGEEIADYSQNFKEGTAVLRGVSVNFYAGDKRASDNSVSSDSPLVKSVSFSKEFDMTKINEVSTTTTENRKSITYFTGGQGEEIADYSQNFKEGTAVLRGVSVNFYAGDK